MRETANQLILDRRLKALVNCRNQFYLSHKKDKLKNTSMLQNFRKIKKLISCLKNLRIIEIQILYIKLMEFQ